MACGSSCGHHSEKSGEPRRAKSGVTLTLVIIHSLSACPPSHIIRSERILFWPRISISIITTTSSLALFCAASNNTARFFYFPCLRGDIIKQEDQSVVIHSLTPPHPSPGLQRVIHTCTLNSLYYLCYTEV